MGLFDDMKARGLWDSYQSYVVGLEPILEATAARGMPVNPDAHKALAAKLDAEIERLLALLQMVPDEVKPLVKCKRKPSYRKPFKPSAQGLIRYMKFRGHTVPTNWKTKKETTQKDDLARLYKQTKDGLYLLVQEYRDAKGMRSNHVKNWAPGPDGRVHPIFYHTATGQLEARRPNTMNAPNHVANNPWAQDFRGIVQAEAGCELLSFDYKGFHALYLAHLSGDTQFQRLVRMDVHSYLTAHFLRLREADSALGWPDDKLRDYLAAIKKTHRATRDAKVKHALLGYNNGMGYRQLFFQYRDFFDNQNEAKRLLGLMDSLFPKAAQFRRDTQELAHEQGYLISQFGCIRYFWEVKRWQGGEWSHGDDAEAAISFPQQNHAHCHLKDAIHQLNHSETLAKAGFCTPIHDDLTFNCPIELIPETIQTVKGIMEAPNPVTKLSVGVEVKRGLKWNEMKVVE